MIPVNDLNSMLFKFNDIGDSAYNSYFDFMNYNSLNAVKNLGMIFYLFFFYLQLIILAYGSKMIKLKSDM